MADLPTGTVTLLFTDIEGSTRLLDELGDRYAEVLTEHRRLLREAFGAHGGVEVDTQGDAFFYAFARASDALAAAETGQRALERGPVRVRVGVHTGEPTVTEEGYVGADVHLAARVMGAGHGGQVLVSEATARLVEGGPRDLGEHRLKDIERPVRLFQLGDGRFPPLKTLNNSNLPLPQTPLLGRKKELADVLRLLRVERGRLVTVTGPGGIGKTRFALEAAHELVEEFAHGVWFVDLSALRDPALVVPTIASTLGAKAELADHAADKHLLLVPDNFEQVVEAAADVAELLRRCPNVQLLVTSREPLHVAGERAYPLRPLAESPAVELFRARAGAADPDFAAPWDTLTAIVDRLDRLPLAIELAAGRVNALGADELLRRLEQRLPLLSSRARDQPQRQRTLRATIEWSYELLPAEEQRVFERLGVFSGGFTIDAAEQVCEGSLDTLDALVRKNLVRAQGDGRFFLFETIKEYAVQRLVRTGATDEVRQRHGAYYLALAEVAEPQVWEGDQAEWLVRLRSERGNIRAALGWFGDSAPERQLRLAAALWVFWMVRGHELEDLAWIEGALASSGDDPSSPRAEALRWASNLAGRLGQLEKASALAEESVAIAREVGDEELLVRSLTRLGVTAYLAGDYSRAKLLTHEARRRAAHAGDRTGHAFALHHLGLIALAERDHDSAVHFLEQGLAMWRDLGTPVWLANTLCDLAFARLISGDERGSRAAFTESLRRSRDLAWQEGIAYCLVGLASTNVKLGKAQRAARLLGAVSALGDDMDIGRVRERYAKEVEVETEHAARTELGDNGYEDAVEAGRRLRIEAAIDEALAP